MKRIARRMPNRVVHIALLLFLMTAAAAWVLPDIGFCQDPVGGQGMDALIRVLQQKGVFTTEEADAFIQQMQDGPDAAANSQNALIRILQQKGILTLEEADGFLQQMQAKPDVSASTQEDQAESEVLKEGLVETREKLDRSVDQLLQRDRLTERKLEELDAKVKDDIAAKQYKSSWAQRTKISGDLRLRYQKDFKADSNEDRLGDSGPEPTNIDRERYRYRARLSLKTKLIDPRKKNVGKAELGLRLATGNTNDPVSTNDTLSDYNNKDEILLDRAYLKWSRTPEEQIWGGKLPQIALIGGRMANPFFSTDLVWDSDLNFEGIAVNLVSDTFEGNSWRAFLTAGAFPLDEYEFRKEGKWLYGAQIGFEHKPFFGLNYRLAVAYYDYDNIQGDVITTVPATTLDADWAAPGVIGGGNTLVQLNDTSDPAFDVLGLAADYNEINVTAMIDIDRFFPVHVILMADYVKNIGYEKDEVQARDFLATIPEDALDQTEGYQVGVMVGYPKVRAAGEWNLSFFYKYLEADAVLDAFTDSDFNTGGTDSEGYIIKTEIGLYQNIWLTARYLSTNEILTEAYGQFAVDTVQLDINARF